MQRVVLQVIILEQAHDAQAQLSLGPVWQEFLLNEGKLGRPMLQDTFKELLLLAWAPVLALLHVEVLDVEFAVLVTDVTYTKLFAHFDDILLLLLGHVVVA